MDVNTISSHDVREPWPLLDASVDCIVTSPPYWGLRDYLHKDQIGQENTPEEFIQTMVQVFREARRVLKDDGSLWLNLADTYWGGKGQSGGAWQGDSLNGKGQNYSKKGQTRPQDRNHEVIKPKDLVGIPWSVALALRNDGWYLRQDIIWDKPNPTPESMTDRCTKAHEYIFLLTKLHKYHFDQAAIMTEVKDSSAKRLNQDIESQTGSSRIPGKTNGNMKTMTGRREGYANKKSVWSVPTTGFAAEFCTSCRRYYEGKSKSLIRVEGAGTTEEKSFCICGRHDSWIEHFATFPPRLISPCIKAGCPPAGIVLDPFMGAGTTGLVALGENRNFLGFELNRDYIDLAKHRLRHHYPLFFTV